MYPSIVHCLQTITNLLQPSILPYLYPSCESTEQYISVPSSNPSLNPFAAESEGKIQVRPPELIPNAWYLFYYTIKVNNKLEIFISLILAQTKETIAVPFSRYRDHSSSETSIDPSKEPIEDPTPVLLLIPILILSVVIRLNTSIISSIESILHSSTSTFSKSQLDL